MAFLASSTESAVEGITPQVHPLDPLTAAEIEAATAAVKAARGLAGTARFVYVSLYEPSKAEIIAYEAGNGATPQPPRLVKIVISERAHRTDCDLCMIDPWTTPNVAPGLGPEDGRFVSPLTWVRTTIGDNGYARPVENLLTRVDLDTMTVVEVTDLGVIPIPATPANYSA